jgi:hypothetical protein
MPSLELVNKPTAGGVAQFVAKFQNSGEIETQAVFVGEFSRDGKVVRSVESPPRSARPGETVDVEFSMDIPDNAKYRVEGRVNFEGRRTATRSVTFRVGPAPPLSWTKILGVSAGAVALLAGIALVIVRRRRETLAQIDERRRKAVARERRLRRKSSRRPKRRVPVS